MTMRQPRWRFVTACAIAFAVTAGGTWLLRTARRPAPLARMPETTRQMLCRSGWSPAPFLSPAPRVRLRNLAGDETTLDDHRGRVVLLNFWGTTCLHCIRELPTLERLDVELRDRGLTVLSVCVDSDDPDVVSRLADRVPRRSLYWCADGTTAARYDVQALPCLFLIDVEGRVAARTEGARTWTVAELARLLPLLRATPN